MDLWDWHLVALKWQEETNKTEKKKRERDKDWGDCSTLAIRISMLETQGLTRALHTTLLISTLEFNKDRSLELDSSTPSREHKLTMHRDLRSLCQGKAWSKMICSVIRCTELHQHVHVNTVYSQNN